MTPSMFLRTAFIDENCFDSFIRMQSSKREAGLGEMIIASDVKYRSRIEPEWLFHGKACEIVYKLLQLSSTLQAQNLFFSSFQGP